MMQELTDAWKEVKEWEVRWSSLAWSGAQQAWQPGVGVHGSLV